jgi:hypothetical protein
LAPCRWWELEEAAEAARVAAIWTVEVEAAAPGMSVVSSVSLEWAAMTI